MPNLIALAIPFFFLLMGVELWAASRRRVKLYRFADVIADLSCGMTQQIFLVFAVAVITGGYVWLYQYRLFTFREGSIWPWVIAFFAVDFVYYVWHRLSHRVNVLWAVHAVHHQSEDYNLAVALRQAVLSVWTIWPLHLPLALIGIPPATFLVVDSLSTLYQFWIHTELIARIAWLAPTLVIAIVATFLLLWFQFSLPLWKRVAAAGFVLLLMGSWGLLLDRRLIWSRSASAPSTAPGPF